MPATRTALGQQVSVVTHKTLRLQAPGQFSALKCTALGRPLR